MGIYTRNSVAMSSQWSMPVHIKFYFGIINACYFEQRCILENVSSILYEIGNFSY